MRYLSVPRHPARSEGRRRGHLLIVSLLFIVGCAQQAPTLPQAKAPRPEHVVTVKLGPADTAAAIEQRFGGRIVVWQEGDFAIVGTDGPPEGLPGGADFSVEPNRDVFLGGGERAVMNGRSSLWAGGRSSLWAGGRSSLWAGGRSSIWAGGEFSWLPENTQLWRQVRLEQGHALATNLGYGVTVAVIDTGVDLAHPALQDALAPAELWWDFYDEDASPQEEGVLGEGGYGHGTNVAGIIRQVAPRATILPLRVLGPDGQGDVAHLAAAIQHAVLAGAQVINLSLGSEAESQAVEAVIRDANARGVLVVASTGNTGDTRVTWPASSAAEKETGELRLSVTSVDSRDLKSTFATYGPSVELSAPGENVAGPAPDMGIASWSGTSMAAPMAAGALALALGETLDPTVSLAEELKKNSSGPHRPIRTAWHGRHEPVRHMIGEGRLDVERFLLAVMAP